MGFWDFVADIPLDTIVKVGTNIFGANQTSSAQNKASSNAIAATNQATDAQLKAQEEANQILRSQQQMASPGLLQMQKVISQQDRLTPSQQQAIEDARRTTLDSLSGGSLRGSARATTAAVRDVEGRMTGDFLDRNTNKASSAAQSLAGQYFGAGNSIAQNEVNMGSTASQGLIGAGQIDYNNTINQNAITGSAIGDIGGVISDYLKKEINNKRDKQYETIDKGKEAV